MFPDVNRQKIWSLVAKAIKDGVIIKAEECSCCGSKMYLEGHHYDYSKPLEVVWLCKSCHTYEHIRINKEKKIIN